MDLMHEFSSLKKTFPKLRPEYDEWPLQLRHSHIGEVNKVPRGSQLLQHALKQIIDIFNRKNIEWKTADNVVIWTLNLGVQN